MGAEPVAADLQLRTLVFLPGKPHGLEEPNELQSMESGRLRHD